MGGGRISLAGGGRDVLGRGVRGKDREISEYGKTVQGGQYPEARPHYVFKEMTITDEAGLEDFRGSLRSSSKLAPSNCSLSVA